MKINDGGEASAVGGVVKVELTAFAGVVVRRFRAIGNVIDRFVGGRFLGADAGAEKG